MCILCLWIFCLIFIEKVLFFRETHLLITIYFKTFLLVCVIHPHLLSFLCFLFSFMFVLSIITTTTTSTIIFISTTKIKQNNKSCYCTITQQLKLKLTKSIQPNSKQPKTLIFLEWTCLPEPSAPPKEVTCFSSSSTSVLVSWKPPPVEHQNGIITKYTIQYAATEGEDTSLKEIKEILPERSQYLLENLEKWTEYRVTVTAHTDVGEGPESLPQLIRTEEDGMFCQKAVPFCYFLPIPESFLTSKSCFWQTFDPSHLSPYCFCLKEIWWFLFYD